MKRFFWLAIPVALLVAACSGGSHTKSDVSETAANFYRALSDDPPRAYTFLSADCKSQISYLDFVATVNNYRGFLGEGELEIKDVSIVEQTHDHITVDYDVVLKTDGEDIPLTDELDLAGPASFVKEDGHWRFEDCAGFPTPDATSTPGAQASATPTFEPGSPAAVEATDDPSFPGEFVDLQAIYGGYWGNQDGVNTASHVHGPIDYSVQGELPPAGGPHWGAAACPPDPDLAPIFCGPVPWGVYDTPFPTESVVHNMEHAGVIIWYNTTDDDVVAQLEDLAISYLDEGFYIVMMPYPNMERETVALTSWGHREKFPVSQYSDSRVQDFIEALECNFDPERLCDDLGSDPLSGNTA